jgi:hypothetical protein
VNVNPAMAHPGDRSEQRRSEDGHRVRENEPDDETRHDDRDERRVEQQRRCISPAHRSAMQSRKASAHGREVDAYVNCDGHENRTG